MRQTVLIVTLLTILSCQKEVSSANMCQVKNPLTELTWLRDSVASYNRSSFGNFTVSQALYRGQTVFSLDLDQGIDAGSSALYYCDGALICRSNITIGGLTSNCGDITKSLTNYTTIYKR